MAAGDQYNIGALTAIEAIVASLETLKTTMTSLFDSFDTRYLGPYANDPTTDNNGDPLAEGMLYTNTGTGHLNWYDGSDWIDIAALAAAVQANAAAAATLEGNASTSASNAATSEANAEKITEGTDGDVAPLGLTHSSKIWAQIAEAAATGSLNLLNPYDGTAINVVGGETDDWQFAENPVDGFLVINAVVIDDDDFTISGDTITLTTAIPEDDEVRWYPVEEFLINAKTEKTTPVDNDIILIEDSEDSYSQKKVKRSNFAGGIYDNPLDAYINAGRIVAYDSFHDVADADPIATSKSGHSYTHIGNGLKVVSGNGKFTASGDASYLPITGSCRVRMWYTTNQNDARLWGWAFFQDSNNYIQILADFSGYRWSISKVVSGTGTNLASGLQQFSGGASQRAPNIPDYLDIYYSVANNILGISHPRSAGSSFYDIDGDSDAQTIMSNMTGMGLITAEDTDPLFHSFTIMQ